MTIFTEYLELVDKMPEDKKYKMLRAIIDFGMGLGEPTEDDQIIYRAFQGIKSKIECSISYHDKKSEAGKKGGEKMKGNQNAKKDWEKQTKQTKQTETIKTNEGEGEDNNLSSLHSDKLLEKKIKKRNSEFEENFERIYERYAKHARKYNKQRSLGDKQKSKQYCLEMMNKGITTEQISRYIQKNEMITQEFKTGYRKQIQRVLKQAKEVLHPPNPINANDTRTSTTTGDG